MGERAVDVDNPSPHAEDGEFPQQYGTLVIRAIFEEYRAPIAARKQRRTFLTGLWIAAFFAAILFIPMRLHHRSEARKHSPQNAPATSGLSRLYVRADMLHTTRRGIPYARGASAKRRSPSPRSVAGHGSSPATRHRVRLAVRAGPSVNLRHADRRRAQYPARPQIARLERRFHGARAADVSHAQPALVGVPQPPNFITLTSASTHVTHGYGTTICVRVLHAKHLTLSGIGGLQPNALDCRRVAPDITTTYVVRATGFSGVQVVRTVRIFVEPNPNEDLTE